MTPQQRLLFPDPRPRAVVPARARRTDPDTSREAAESFTTKKLSALQAQVLAWFIKRGGRATDEELRESPEFSGYGLSTVVKRRRDLVELGQLRDSGERRFNKRGRRMIVWEVVAL